MIDIQMDIGKARRTGVIDKLLTDKTTCKHIIWANGDHWADEITDDDLPTVQTRVAKSKAQQKERTGKRGEVFTPLWLCEKMNNMAMHEMNDDDWQTSITRKILEITCGEAPFLVSRYDTVTGEAVPIDERIGILDRKLRLVSTNAADKNEWFYWAVRAFQSTYGYEFCGDSLFIARLNLWMTFIEYFEERWQMRPRLDHVRHIARIVSWNVWQMDGLTGRVPSIDGMGDACWIMDWDNGEMIEFSKLQANDQQVRR